ncbi:MAG: hypothetical protein ACO4CT_13245 [Planctomycetota bacterium]
MPRTRPGLPARLFVVLAWLAILGHLAESTHHAAVTHELGADGQLHHACASHVAHAHRCDPSDGSGPDAPLPQGDHPPGDHPDGEGDPCPLQKPCVDTGLGLELALVAWEPWAPGTEAVATETRAAPPLDVLDVAPKQSPPTSC